MELKIFFFVFLTICSSIKAHLQHNRLNRGSGQLGQSQGNHGASLQEVQYQGVGGSGNYEDSVQGVGYGAGSNEGSLQEVDYQKGSENDRSFFDEIQSNNGNNENVVEEVGYESGNNVGSLQGADYGAANNVGSVQEVDYVSGNTGGTLDDVPNQVYPDVGNGQNVVEVNNVQTGTNGAVQNQVLNGGNFPSEGNIQQENVQVNEGYQSFGHGIQGGQTTVNNGISSLEQHKLNLKLKHEAHEAKKREHLAAIKQEHQRKLEEHERLKLEKRNRKKFGQGEIGLQKVGQTATNQVLITENAPTNNVPIGYGVGQVTENVQSANENVNVGGPITNVNGYDNDVQSFDVRNSRGDINTNDPSSAQPFGNGQIVQNGKIYIKQQIHQPGYQQKIHGVVKINQPINGVTNQKTIIDEKQNVLGSKHQYLHDRLAEKKNALNEKKQAIRKDLEQRKEAIQGKIQQHLQDATQRKEVLLEKIQQGKEVLREKVQQKKEALQGKIQQHLQDAAQRKGALLGKIQQKKEALQGKIQQHLQDAAQRKEALLEKVQQGKEVLRDKIQQGKEVLLEKIQQGNEALKGKIQQQLQDVVQRKGALLEKIQQGKEVLSEKIQQGKEALQGKIQQHLQDKTQCKQVVHDNVQQNLQGKEILREQVQNVGNGGFGKVHIRRTKRVHSHPKHRHRLHQTAYIKGKIGGPQGQLSGTLGSLGTQQQSTLGLNVGANGGSLQIGNKQVTQQLGLGGIGVGNAQISNNVNDVNHGSSQLFNVGLTGGLAGANINGQIGVGGVDVNQNLPSLNVGLTGGHVNGPAENVQIGINQGSKSGVLGGLTQGSPSLNVGLAGGVGGVSSNVHIGETQQSLNVGQTSGVTFDHNVQGGIGGAGLGSQQQLNVGIGNENVQLGVGSAGGSIENNLNSAQVFSSAGAGTSAGLGLNVGGLETSQTNNIGAGLSFGAASGNFQTSQSGDQVVAQAGFKVRDVDFGQTLLQKSAFSFSGQMQTSGEAGLGAGLLPSQLTG